MRKAIDRSIALSFLLSALLAGGCRAPGECDRGPAKGTGAAGIAAKPAIENDPELRAAEIRDYRYVGGYSVENRPIEIRVIGAGDEVVFIMASIHGNESAGTPLVARLADFLLQNPQLVEGRQIVLLPEANPDGMAAGRRGNSRSVDLNRNFPAANRRNNANYGNEALSEPEAGLIKAIIATYAPDRIVTIHQPLSCIDYDGPAGSLAERMAALCGLPVRKLGTRPGSLGAYAGEALGIPIVTVELPRDADRLGEGELFDRYGKMLLASVVHPEEIELPNE